MFTGSLGTNIAQQAHHLHLYHHNHLNHQHQHLQQQKQNADSTNQLYTSIESHQRDSHQLSSDNQLLLPVGDGDPHPQVYQQLRGSELFSIASQNCLQTQNYHQPLATGFGSGSINGPQYLETNQSLVAHFSQHSTVALTNSGALANGISMSNASQFVSVMQQQQQQQLQHHTPNLEVGDVINPALFFHHHNHSSHHVTTTTNNQQHLHMNLASSASFSGPSLPHLQTQQQPQQQHNSNHPLPRPRSSNAMLMSSIGAFDELCHVNSISNHSNAIDLPTSEASIKLHHGDAPVICGPTYDVVDPTHLPRSATTASNNLGDSIRQTGTATNKFNPSIDTSDSTLHNYISNGNRDNYSIQFEKLTIGPTNGVSLSNSVILNNHSATNNKHCSNNPSKNSRIISSNSKIQDKLDMRKSFESPRKTFACPTCSKGFTEKFNMKRHMQIHSQSRPKYICNECSKSFAWKDNFIRHRKAAHVTSLGQYQG